MIKLNSIALLIAGILFASSVLAADVVTQDDTARFFAGMKPTDQSPLALLNNDPSVKHHANLLDMAFGKLEAQQFAKIREWSAANLTSPRPVMYYLFSGPDFLYANAFFPHASTYVFGGLEPSGPIPDLSKLSRGTIGQTLHNIQVSLGSILKFSYFITAHMRTDLSSGSVNGSLPILYVFLARSGKTIRDVSLVNLDEGGNLQIGDGVRTKSTARGVRIVFSSGDGPPKTLYYFSTNAADEYYGQYALLNFSRQFGQGDSLLKSASYLLHRASFSHARNFLLEQSALILQDDSGIPLANFQNGKWFLRPYGRYTSTLDMFSQHLQPRLIELYQRKTPGAIDFRIGYSSRFNESNLLLAIRNTGARDLTTFGLKDASRHEIDRRAVLKKPELPANLRAMKIEDNSEIY